ncbi:MAG: PH domain-containing protein [bacterium]
MSKIMLDESSLKIIKGVLNKEELRLPYRRIQSVEIKQRLLHRLLGVSRLVISTTNDADNPNNTEAQNESDDEVIPIIDYDLAQAIADTLTNRVEVERMQIQQTIHTEPQFRK